MTSQFMRYGHRTGLIGFGMATIVVFMLFLGSYILAERSMEEEASFMNGMGGMSSTRSGVVYIAVVLGVMTLAVFFLNLMEIFVPQESQVTRSSLLVLLICATLMQFVAISLIQYLLNYPDGVLTFRDGRVWGHMLLRQAHALYGIAMLILGWYMRRASFLPAWMAVISLILGFWQVWGNATTTQAAMRQSLINMVAYAAMPVWAVLISAILLMLEVKPSPTETLRTLPTETASMTPLPRLSKDSP